MPKWIADATVHVMAREDPTLTLCYLPHLDYNLQRLGPDPAHPRLRKDLEEVDAVCAQLIDAAERSGRDVVVVSEYGITPVTGAVHVNRALREAGLLRVRSELGRDVFDEGRVRHGHGAGANRDAGEHLAACSYPGVLAHAHRLERGAVAVEDTLPEAVREDHRARADGALSLDQDLPTGVEVHLRANQARCADD